MPKKHQVRKSYAGRAPLYYPAVLRPKPTNRRYLIRRYMNKDIKEQMKKYTPFQRAVWTTCMAIPKGQTRSYGWIAARIGRPKAARAVGAALGRNPFAPTVPCHRVIKSDGTLGGFSAPGGLRIKVKLLRREKAPGY